MGDDEDWNWGNWGLGGLDTIDVTVDRLATDRAVVERIGLIADLNIVENDKIEMDDGLFEMQSLELIKRLDPEKDVLSPLMIM
jgi:hypothetical protein